MHTCLPGSLGQSGMWSSSFGGSLQPHGSGSHFLLPQKGLREATGLVGMIKKKLDGRSLLQHTSRPEPTRRGPFDYSAIFQGSHLPPDSHV